MIDIPEPESVYLPSLKFRLEALSQDVDIHDLVHRAMSFDSEDGFYIAPEWVGPLIQAVLGMDLWR